MLTAYYPAFAYNPVTYDHDIWVGNITPTPPGSAA